MKALIALDKKQYDELLAVAAEVGLTDVGVIDRACLVLRWIAKCRRDNRYPLALKEEVTDAFRREAYDTLNWDYLFPNLTKRLEADAK